MSNNTNLSRYSSRYNFVLELDCSTIERPLCALKSTFPFLNDNWEMDKVRYHVRMINREKSRRKKHDMNIVSKGAKIRNRYNQVPHLTQDTNRKVTNSQLYTTNESQEVSPLPAGDHKAQINRCAQRHNEHKTRKKPIKDPQKKYRLGTVSKLFYWRA